MPLFTYLLPMVYLFVVSGAIQFSEETGDIENQYIGCYYDIVGQLNWTTVLSDSNSLNIGQCINNCRIYNRTFAILQDGRTCLCGDSFNASLSYNNCTIPCSGNSKEYCGGSNKGQSYSVFYTACPIGHYGEDCSQVCHCKGGVPCNLVSGVCPNGCEGVWTGPKCSEESTFAGRYVGCYRDVFPGDRALSALELEISDSNPIRWCSHMCAMNGSTYAGLQFKTQCFCGENYNAYGKRNEGDCSTPCDKNSSQKCGGQWANSVYSVCSNGSFGPDCLDSCNCANKEICSVLNGTCKSDCKPGWSGKSCNMRNCIVNNGDCSVNQSCLTVILNDVPISQCVCKLGYGKDKLWSDCIDVNECAFVPSVCNNMTATCQNTIGGYNCSCRAGFHKISPSDTCGDIDECALLPSVCHTELPEVCVNTFGSYSCECKNGYQREPNKNCTDINECIVSPSVCDNNSSTCNNTIGSFICVCNEGFEMNNQSGKCQDIDECKQLPCDQNSEVCTNTVGFFYCGCKDGYSSINDTFLQCTAIINKSPPNGTAGRIAGAVVGSILGLAVIIGITFLLLYFYRRRKKNDTLINRSTTEAQVLSPDQDTFMRRKNIQSIFANGSSQTPSYKALQTVRDKLSDPKTMQEEFQNVPIKTKDFSVLGSREELKKKNRFMNIIPYDWNRVVLSRNTDDDMSEYINASYVQGYNDFDKFIAGQGPRTESLDDFWRMIVEKKIVLIVMITNLVENERNKCAQYWPNLGATAKFGDVSVTLLEEDDYPSYTTRRLKATTQSISMEITQWHYVAWPDHGVPKDVKCFLNFHAKVRQQMSPDKYTLVHCSAGAGRTGAFIATDYLLEQEKIERDVDVLECLKALRNQRSAMIQNLRQYEFLHMALFKAFMLGKTTIPMEKVPSNYQSWRKIDKSSNKSMLEIQFQDIEDTKIDIEEEEEYLVSSKAAGNDRLKEMDAALIYSWKRKDAFIWAKLLDDSESFWTLRKEKNSRVVIFIDSADNCTDGFLPSPDRPISLKCSTLFMESGTKDSFGSWCVVTESAETEENNYANVEQESIYQNAEVHSSITRISVIQIHEPSGKLWMNPESFFSLFKFIESVRSEFGESNPIMVTSRCDCSVAGFLIAVLNSIEMIKLEQEIDLYQIVLNIRKSKSELFCSMSSYEDLHDFIERYIQMSAA